MVPTGQAMAFFLESSDPSVSTTIAGKINYTAIVADARPSSRRLNLVHGESHIGNSRSSLLREIYKPLGNDVQLVSS